MAGSFEKQRVLSPSEYRVFAIIESEITAQGGGYRVFAQTSLGEILRSKNEDAFRSINSKRVDILVIDRSGWPSWLSSIRATVIIKVRQRRGTQLKKKLFAKLGCGIWSSVRPTVTIKIRSHLRELLASKVSVMSH